MIAVLLFFRSLHIIILSIRGPRYRVTVPYVCPEKEDPSGFLACYSTLRELWLFFHGGNLRHFTLLAANLTRLWSHTIPT